jgi:hypothetical protein
MAAGGLMYTASFSNVNVTSAIQNIWEILAGANTSILIHSMRLTFTPTIVSGVAQDVRAQLNVQTITSAGTGGAAVTPRPLNARNTVTAVSSFNRTVVTTQGALGVILDSENVSIIVPFERIYTPDQRIPISAGNRLALNLSVALGTAYSASSEIYFEEI